MARRCLASERTVPSTPVISGVTYSNQGTSSSEMPWTANCNQRVVHQVDQLFPAFPPPHRYLHSTQSAALSFLRNIPAFPRLRISGQCPSAALHGGPAYVGFGNHLPLPCHGQARPGPFPCQSGWTGHGGGGMLTIEATLGVMPTSWDVVAPP